MSFTKHHPVELL